MDDDTIIGPSSRDPAGVGAGSLTPPPGTMDGDLKMKWPAPRPQADLSGSILGDYRLVRKVAQGGMGEVYEAIQLKLDRKVALKVLTDRLASQVEFLKRFEREAKAAAALNHPNVVQVYDFGEADGRYYLIMEFVEGQDLGNYIKSAGKLSITEALTAVEEAAIALKAACEKSIIHRDIKPDNLMRTTSGRIKVSDLGLAKKLTDDSEVTATGIGIGSPHFLAPEQADDAAHVDHRADIYALGITLLYLLTGRHPYSGTSAFAIVMAHASKPLPTGADLGTPLPEEIEALIQRMAAKRPEDRYQDYDTLITDVVRVRTGFMPAIKPVPNRASKTVAIAAVAGVLIAGVLVVLLTQGRSPEPVDNTAVAPKTSPAVAKTTPSTEPVLEERGPRPSFSAPGGPRGQNTKGAGRMPPPLPRQKPKNWDNLVKPGTAGEMMAEVAAYAATNKTDYVGIIDRYHDLDRRGLGPQWQREIQQRLNNATLIHEVVVHEEMDKYEAKMKELIRSNRFEEAYTSWQTFPENLRTLEVDQAIVDILKKFMPPEYQPPNMPAMQKGRE